MKTHSGSCHCGAVRFEAEGTLERVVYCNCSICAKTAYLHWYVAPERFRLLAGEDALTLYQWGTRTARHLFCKHCGVSAFRHPRSDPELFDVNARCLEGVDVGALPVDGFDGQHWEEAAASRALDGQRKGAVR